jgi:hypothetical protein
MAGDDIDWDGEENSDWASGVLSGKGKVSLIKGGAATIRGMSLRHIPGVDSDMDTG